MKKNAGSIKNNSVVAVVGLGYVGLPLALLASKKGHEVIGIDVDSDKVRKINSRILPFEDKYLSLELEETALHATTDPEAMRKADIIVICVPTPVYKNHLPNLKPLTKAALAVAGQLRKGQLVVVESTINPGVCDTVVMPILEKWSGLKEGRDFYLSHCPERINPGDAKWNVENIPRVAGSFSDEGLIRTLDFYRSVLTSEIKPMGSVKEAEAVKIVENAFRDINIAFVNELARSFSYLGIDIVNVIEGAATKPFSFMPHFPGAGVGGHCIPVDPYYLIEYAKKNGFTHHFLTLARHINNDMPAYTADLAARALKVKGIPMASAKVAVLGLAYKANIDDCRESPSFKIVERLKKYGADVATYDPYVLSRSSEKSLKAALDNASAVVIATSHSEFIRSITPELIRSFGIKAVVDGRNCLKPKDFDGSGIIYAGIGRGFGINEEKKLAGNLTNRTDKQRVALAEVAA
ncbi:nucleotide sugar dehydrogenase [Candidatus Giovannonibacteria bacterium]|nr:nucleotide sugar dehydrogenase [Candidatus Giovannonibacteria bacterium]